MVSMVSVVSIFSKSRESSILGRIDGVGIISVFNGIGRIGGISIISEVVELVGSEY